MIEEAPNCYLTFFHHTCEQKTESIFVTIWDLGADHLCMNSNSMKYDKSISMIPSSSYNKWKLHWFYSNFLHLRSILPWATHPMINMHITHLCYDNDNCVAMRVALKMIARWLCVCVCVSVFLIGATQLWLSIQNHERIISEWNKQASMNNQNHSFDCHQFRHEFMRSRVQTYAKSAEASN